MHGPVFGGRLRYGPDGVGGAPPVGRVLSYRDAEGYAPSGKSVSQKEAASLYRPRRPPCRPGAGSLFQALSLFLRPQRRPCSGFSDMRTVPERLRGGIILLRDGSPALPRRSLSHQQWGTLRLWRMTCRPSGASSATVSPRFCWWWLWATSAAS